MMRWYLLRTVRLVSMNVLRISFQESLSKNAFCKLIETVQSTVSGRVL